MDCGPTAEYDFFVISNLRASTGEAITVEMCDTSCQRAAQHLQLLPADHVMRQVLLEDRDATVC